MAIPFIRLNKIFMLVMFVVFTNSLHAQSVTKNVIKINPIRVLIVGGDAAHDFQLWYKNVDSLTLSKGGLAKVSYTEDIASLPERLKKTDVLYLCNNRTVDSENVRKAIFDFVDAGKGLILGHATTCYNWRDWPEYNAKLVGGGVSWHEHYGKFSVQVIKQHPVMNGVALKFDLYDELYYYVPDNLGENITVLATSASTETYKNYPCVFVVKHPKARIVGITLGHDGVTHTSVQYETILRNALKWVSKRQ